jgi:hypothetical protein
LLKLDNEETHVEVQRPGLVKKSSEESKWSLVKEVFVGDSFL